MPRIDACGRPSNMGRVSRKKPQGQDKPFAKASWLRSRFREPRPPAVNFSFTDSCVQTQNSQKSSALFHRKRRAPMHSWMRLAHEETADGRSGWKSAGDCMLAEEWLDARLFLARRGGIQQPGKEA